MRKLLRTLQTYLPLFADKKYNAQRFLRRLRQKPFDKDFMYLSIFAPPQGTVFLDIGANRGQSIDAMRLYHPDIPIVAFEPSRRTFARLERLSAGVAQITLVNEGLSDVEGSFKIYTPVYNGYVFDGLASTVREEAEKWLGPDRIFGFDPSKLRIEEDNAVLRTLDSYVEEKGLKPSFIKLDVQGAEEHVLRGGTKTLERFQPLIMLEQPETGDVEAILGPMGYRVYHFDGQSLCAGAANAKNVFYLSQHQQR
jgi:FkbM family methyltransferase